MDPPMWSSVENSLHECRWNYGAVAVMAIPSWKIFVFGGKVGQISEDEKQGQYCNDVAIMDTGNNRWYYPDIPGTLPPPRSDMPIEFDSKLSKLLVFGGWQGEWYNDIWTLDVGSIVGPPYAITEVYPSLGPITGLTELEILGIDFVNKDVVVRFASRKGFVDCKGTYVNNSKITVITPDFQQFPAGTVDVRVALGGDSFTTTFGRFTYFPVTAAKWTLIYGPGLLEGGAANEEAMFVIQARTSDNVNRTTGGDEFRVQIAQVKAGEDGRDVPLPGVRDLTSGMTMACFDIESDCSHRTLLHRSPSSTRRTASIPWSTCRRRRGCTPSTWSSWARSAARRARSGGRVWWLASTTSWPAT
jgi:dynein heavy chain, axonemal